MRTADDKRADVVAFLEAADAEKWAHRIRHGWHVGERHKSRGRMSVR